MAQIIEENITITISRMVADGASDIGGELVTNETVEALKAVAQELVGDSLLVEIRNA